jgi:hypothetical protein
MGVTMPISFSIPDLSITTAKLADLSVTTAKLADLSVATAKLADLSVTTAKIGDGHITTPKIASGHITNPKLATGIASASGIFTAGQAVNFIGDAYQFCTAWVGSTREPLYLYETGSDPNNQIAKWNVQPVGAGSYWLRWRYITATDQPFIFILKNSLGQIIGVWEGDDPPNHLWGLTLAEMKKKPLNEMPIFTLQGVSFEIEYPATNLKKLRDDSIKLKKSIFELLK